MTLRNYLILMAACTVMAWAGVVLIVMSANPETASGPTFAIFYACLFLAVVGLLSMVGFSARVFILNHRLFISREVAVSFRQSLLMATLVVSSLWLLSRGQLNWWTGILMVVIMTLMESFYISGRVPRQ